jgi:uncharacterized membrane protein
MADLIAIGYDDTTTAIQAMEEAERLAGDLVIQADSIAAIIRSDDGKLKTITNTHAVGGATVGGMFWGLLFGILFFIPFLGMAVGAGMGALMGKMAKTGMDKGFQDQVREMLKPGTSALFIVFEKVTPDKALDALSKFGGTVLKTSLSDDATAEINKELHGDAAAS